jgi:hypothetical protein
MRGVQSFGLAAFVLLGAEAHAQPRVNLDAAAVTGGDTNDLQLAYGAGVEFGQRGAFTAAADFLYVRDFFEFEPDAPLDDAQIYTDVLGAFGTARVSLVPRSDRAVQVFLLGGPGWLRARALGRASDHLGVQVGGSLGLWMDHRTGLRLEARYVAALTGRGADPPEQRLSFWRTGVSLTINLHDPARQP